VEAWAGSDLPVDQANHGGLGQASGGREGHVRRRLPGSNPAAHQGNGEGCARPTTPVGVQAAVPEGAARNRRRRWRAVGTGSGMEIFRAAPRFGS
jgi:hypothetical protein